MTEIALSFIAPIYNEEMNVSRLYSELSSVCFRLNKVCEIIFIDDGSSDGSWFRLQQLRERDEKVSIVRFSRRCGQTAALACGFKLAQGGIIVTMDSDLQSDPNDIDKLLLKIDEGYDAVAGWRAVRRDPFVSRVLPSIIGNMFIEFFWRLGIHDIGCTLRAYRRRVVEEMSLFGEMHRFIPLLIDRNKYRIAEVKVNHLPRVHGRSRYGFGRILRIARDLTCLILVRKNRWKTPDYVVAEQHLATCA